jgi:hypothetical protein
MAKFNDGYRRGSLAHALEFHAGGLRKVTGSLTPGKGCAVKADSPWAFKSFEDVTVMARLVITTVPSGAVRYVGVAHQTAEMVQYFRGGSGIHGFGFNRPGGISLVAGNLREKGVALNEFVKAHAALPLVDVFDDLVVVW